MERPRVWIAIAFMGGVLLTLGFKDIYPDLERRYRQARRARAGLSPQEIKPQHEDTIHKEDIKLGIEGTIGNTPLLKIKSLSDATGCEILAKAEFLNGAGNSPKDRVALAMLTHAERAGLLAPHSGDAIYEGTVGSTGISLAAIARARGYVAHICMPSDQSAEKADLLAKLGAVVERVRPAPIVDQEQFVNKARARAREHTADGERRGRGYFADQFENEANWRAHYEGTGPEIWAQTGGRCDAFVAGAGTGGTISGVALFLKPRLPKIQVVLADPQGSGLYNRIKYGVMFDPKEREGTRRRHQVDSIVEGIGVNRVTQNLEAGRELIDDAVRVSDEQALKMARYLVEKDGIFIGSSSAVNCEYCSTYYVRHLLMIIAGVAAAKTAIRLGPGHRIVTILCDSGKSANSQRKLHILIAHYRCQTPVEVLGSCRISLRFS
ncbi:hypothetical protein FH972_025928 [Carpinus fangiana]|uniref:cysteine synthase n=1 Tax=Carpinus fangiana TaxID=176857 RepID=A0A5N6L2U5_9ROSI|nr:hypothetical protein FH972_025928 [Carpinus fangiana]